MDITEINETTVILIRKIDNVRRELNSNIRANEYLICIKKMKQDEMERN